MDGLLSIQVSGHSGQVVMTAAPSAQPRGYSRMGAIVAVLVVLMLDAPASRAQTPDPADIAAGMSLFRQKGGCQLCHGWAADGRKMDNQMPDGANLRESTLDRQALILTIKCGRPGRSMPAFDKFAYSDGRCYGLKQADLKARNLPLTDPPATLAPNEVELLADFLFAKVVGKGPMDHAKCIDYWGSDVEVCNEFPK
jgi:mono/diheme cytochrome c family protein